MSYDDDQEIGMGAGRGAFGMDLGSILLAGAVGLLVAIMAGWFARRSRPVQRTRTEDARRNLPRRAGGGSLLMLQEFVEPRTVHVEQAREEWVFENEHPGPGDGQPSGLSIGDALLASLCRAPLDLDEVRGHLKAADRAGLDWRRLYRETAELVRTTNPQRAPSLPPLERVAPWLNRGDD